MRGRVNNIDNCNKGRNWKVHVYVIISSFNLVYVSHSDIVPQYIQLIIHL
jgi:hypothetical protein